MNRFPTSEYAAACAAKTAYAALDALSGKLHDVGTAEARQHAKEAAGAAKIARELRKALLREHRLKVRKPPNASHEGPDGSGGTPL